MADRVTLDGSGDALPLYAAPFAAQITGSAGSSPVAYAWKEMRLNPAGGALAAMENGRVGSTTISPAYEINNHTVPTGTNVWLRLRGWQGSQLVYEFHYEPTLADPGQTFTITNTTFDYGSGDTFNYTANYTTDYSASVTETVRVFDGASYHTLYTVVTNAGGTAATITYASAVTLDLSAVTLVLPSPLYATVSDSLTNNAPLAFVVQHLTSGTPAANFGVSQLFMLDDTVGPQSVAQFIAVLTNATHATLASRLTVNMYDHSVPAREVMRWEADGSAAKMSAFGVAAVGQQSGDVATGLVNLGFFSSATYSGTQPGLFAMTTNKTVTGTASETTLNGGGQGSLSLAANYLTAGATLRVRAGGSYSLGASQQVTFRLKIDGSAIGHGTLTNSGVGATSGEWFLDAQYTVRTTGAPGTSYGILEPRATLGSGNPMLWVGAADSYAVDTTASHTLDFTGQLSNSADSVTCELFTVEKVY